MIPSIVTIVLSICIPFLLCTLWAIFDAARREFGSIEQKAIWVLVAAVPFIGFIIYLIFGMKRGLKSMGKEKR